MTPLTKYPGTNYSLEEQCTYAVYNYDEMYNDNNFQDINTKYYPIPNVSIFLLYIFIEKKMFIFFF